MKLIRLDPGIRPQHYRVCLKIDPDALIFEGRVEIDVALTSHQRTIIFHAADLAFTNVELVAPGAEKASVLVPQSLAADGTMALSLPATLKAVCFTLKFKYSASLRAGLEGLYKVNDDGRNAVFTQFEAIGARKAFPCFDEPGFKAPFDIEILAPRGVAAISNSREIGSWKSGDGFIHHVFASTPPLPTYLVMLAVGKFDIVEWPAIAANKIRSRPIPLRGIAMRGKGGEMATALRMTAPLVLAEEQYFGIAYPFDKLDVVAVPDFGAGGMENAGAITYDENYVLLDANASIDEKRDFLSIHAHEIAHHWFGNLVTPIWWDDLWLNESFASFMESKFAHIIKPDWQYDSDILVSAHEAMIMDHCASVRCVWEPVDSVDGISAAFDAITYQKGAAVLAHVEDMMGAGNFKNFIHQFLTGLAFGGMSTATFMQALAVFPKGAEPARLLQDAIAKKGVGVRDLPKLDHVPRYYVFDVDPAGWRAIFKTIKKQKRAVALATAINLDVALYAGRVDLALYLEGVRAMAQHADWQVAGFAIERLIFLASAGGALEKSCNRVLFECYASGIKSAHLQKPIAGKTIASWQKLMKRHAIIDMVARSTAAPNLREHLRALGNKLTGRKRINLDNNTIAPPDVSAASIIASAISGGDEVLYQMLGHFKNTANLGDRGSWLEAIAASHAPSSTKVIEQLLLSTDLRNQEVPDLLMARANWLRQQNALWQIVTHRALELLARLDGDLDVTLIQLADEFATEDLAMKVEATISPLLGRLRGGVVQLKQTLEHIRAKAALLQRLQEQHHA